VKLAETKIYLQFIFWFIGVSFLPIAILFIIFYAFKPEMNTIDTSGLQRAVLLGIFISLAFVLILSLIATKYLAGLITKPIHISVQELSRVVKSLSKSIQDLLEISKDNSQVAQFLLASSRQQQKGLKSGNQAVEEMVQSLNQITQKTKASAQDAVRIDKLASQGGDQAKLSLDSLVVLKHLATENQKLTQALGEYATQVQNIAKRAEALTETANFLSLNVSIEANKTSFSEAFSDLVLQIRELNINTEQAATSIQTLAKDMQRQIQQSKQTVIFEQEETSKSINIITQAIKFLGRIINNVSSISQSIKVISKETEETDNEASKINSMIGDLNNEAKSLVKQTNDITKIIDQQSAVTRNLNRSSRSLNKVTGTLNSLVGKT